MPSRLTDAATGTAVLFGGYGTRAFGDTWTWDGTTWTQQAPAAHPSARSNAVMAYDAATGKILLKTPMSAGSNAPVAVDGDYVIAGAGVPLSAKQHPLIIAYKLGAAGCAWIRGTTTRPGSGATSSQR